MTSISPRGWYAILFISGVMAILIGLSLAWIMANHDRDTVRSMPLTWVLGALLFGFGAAVEYSFYKAQWEPMAGPQSGPLYLFWALLTLAGGILVVGLWRSVT